MNMANLMSDILSHSSTYTTVRQIATDASKIKSSIMGTYQNTSLQVSELKRNNKHIRSVFQWFSNKSEDPYNTTSPLETDDEEFDAGFRYNNSEEQETKVLDADNMKDLIRARNREMHKIASKQIESKLYNASMIISTINDRSAETLASLRTIDSTTLEISKKLDLLIQSSSNMLDQIRKEQRKNQLHQSSGRLTVDSLSNYIKNNRQQVTKSITESLMDMTGLTVIDRKVNEKVQSFQHNLLTKIFEIPFIKKHMNPYGSYVKDYGRFVEGGFDRNPAIFDNMVRKTIISIIPDYLKQITNALTGKKYNIAANGSLTTAAIENKFVKSIDVTFDSTSISESQIKETYESVKNIDDEFTSADMREVLRIMVQQYVYYIYSSEHSTNHLSPDFFINGGDQGLHLHIAELLAKGKGKTAKYWLDIISVYSSKLIADKNYRSNFASAINRALYGLDNAAKRNIAESSKVTDVQFTQKMFDLRALERMKYDSSRFEFEGKTLRQLIRDGYVQRESLSKEQLEELDKPITSFADLNEKIEDSATDVMENLLMGQQRNRLLIISKIFEILNRGVNVYFVNANKGFKSIKAQHTTRDKMNEKPQLETNVDVPVVTVPEKTSENKTDEEDEEKVNEASYMLMASASSGNTNANNITQQLGTMRNFNVQQRLKTIVSGSIERSSKKEEKKSFIGKTFLFILSTAKSFFTKIISGAKLFLNNSVTNFVKSMLSDSVNKMKTGANAVKEGFTGIKTRVKPRQHTKTTTKSEQKTATTNDSDSLFGGLTDMLKESAPGKAISNIGNKIKDKLGKSEFGQGVLSSFSKHQKEKSKITPSSLSDQSSEKIDSILSSTSPMGSVFNKIFNVIDDIQDQFKNLFDTALNKQKAEEEKKKQQQKQKKKSLAFDMGKILGGLLGVLSGILQAVLTVVVSMKGFKLITDMIHKVLTNSLKPLNKAFQSLYKAIKPTMKTIGKVLNKIVSYLSDIVISIIDIMQPIFEAIGPLLEQMMDILKPILKIVTDVLDILVVPLTAVMETVIVPIIQGVANAFQIITGILQVGLGTIITVHGWILSAIGVLTLSLGSGSLYEKGKEIAKSGENLFKSGVDNVTSGLKSSIALATSSMNKLLGTSEKTSTSDETEKKLVNQKQTTINKLNGSPMDGIYGSGDERAPYKFDDSVQEALSNIKSLASGIFSLFDIDQADTETKLQTAKDKEAYTKAQFDAAGLDDDARKEIDDRAFELFKSTINNEQLHGETDEEYRARYEKDKEKYWTMAAAEIVKERVKKNADATESDAISLINETLFGKDDNGENSFEKFFKEEDKKAQSNSGKLFQALADFINAARDDDEYYDDEYYYEGGTGDIFQAASEVFTAVRKRAGSDLHWNGTSVTDVEFDDGMVIDKISPVHCTAMMAAIVKRMGYYLPSNGRQYSDTYQGDDQMYQVSGQHGSSSWGWGASDGHPNIYDRDGNVSQDWIFGGPGGAQAGDITFNGTGGAHAHMGAYQGADGNWFGFNGGADDSLASSVKLGEYYLKHGQFPTDTKLNPVPGRWFNDHQWTDQLGAIAPPMSYWIRYVGPKTKAKRRKVKKSSSRKGSGNLGKDDLIESAAEIFEAYQKTNPSVTYSNGLWPNSITTRSGHTRQIRPDCSGTMSAAIQELGYTLRDANGYDVGDIGLRSGTWGTQTKNTLIYDSPTAKTPSKDWTVLEYSKSKLEPGDILAFPPPPGNNSGHLTMPIVDLQGSPRGLDGGCGIAQSPAAAVAYLNGKKDIPWVYNGGMDRMKKIWRYNGTSVSSANSISRTKQQSKTLSTTKRSKGKSSASSSSLRGKKKVLTAASETFLAALKAQKRDHGPYGHGAILKNVRFDDGMVIDNMSAMCTGTQAAIVKRMGYYLPKDNNRNYTNTYQGNMYMGWANGTPGGWGINNSDGRPNIYDKNGKKSKDWIIANDGTYQAGDITLPSQANGRYDQTMWHAHMAAFQYGGQWYGFNGGDPTNNSESVKGQNIANYYLSHGSMPTNGSGIDINKYNSNGYNQGIVIRYVGSGDEYTPSAFDIPEIYDPSPILEFMSDPSMFGGYGEDYITPQLFENIPYEKIDGPMFVPDFDQNPAQIFDNTTPDQVYQGQIINTYTIKTGLEYLSNYIDEFLVSDIKVQSSSIRNLAYQISEEFPEYIDYYFDDEDTEFSDEDDMLIEQLVAMFE